MRPRRPWASAAPLLLAMSLWELVGCAPAPLPPRTVPEGIAPWQVPPQELGTQRIFRARYEGPRGEGSFRLTFRLEGLEHYQAEANIALGKKLWTLGVDGAEGLWIDHRADAYCRLAGRLELADSLLAPLPFQAFPALLLGRLPEPPASPPRLRGGELTFEGGDRRRWKVEVEAGQVVAWTLWDGGRPVAWWERTGPEAILSDRENHVQLRWREVVREALAVELQPLAIPEGYREIPCGGLDLSVPPLVPDPGP